jgi:nitrogen-specific signal transduction histidine kinase
VRNEKAHRVYEVSSNQLHDVRNRLTVVKGIAQLLARQIDRADWQRDRIARRVDSLQSEIDELEVMIDRLKGSAADMQVGSTTHAPSDSR